MRARARVQGFQVAGRVVSSVLLSASCRRLLTPAFDFFHLITWHHSFFSGGQKRPLHYSCCFVAQRQYPANITNLENLDLDFSRLHLLFIGLVPRSHALLRHIERMGSLLSRYGIARALLLQYID